MHHAFSNISLPSLHDYDLKMPNFTFYTGHEHKTATFFFFSWTSIQPVRIQPQEGLPTFDELKEMKYARLSLKQRDYTFEGDVTWDDSRERFWAQHSVAMLEQCCSHSKQFRNNVVMLCCAKNRRCEPSRVTSPLSDVFVAVAVVFA